ncbi:MAG TPA: DUF1858 domain-containing protein [Nitrospirota bacterium]|nr:DUF1858 domain-containing protein [Nitrospirota bacterium]
MGSKLMIDKDMIIGDVLNVKPTARAVLEKYFGDGCFTCPGIMWESLSFGAAMHNRKVEDIIDEINALGE